MQIYEHLLSTEQEQKFILFCRVSLSLFANDFLRLRMKGGKDILEIVATM